MNRTYPARPVAAVGAVVTRRTPSGLEIVLVKRGKDPAKGKWSVPGGAIEPGERAREAAVREVMEECGLEIRLCGVFDVFDNLVRDEAGGLQYHYVIIDFLAKAVEGEMRPGSDVSEAIWVPVGEAGRMDLTRGTLEIIQRLALHGAGPVQNL
ncbi:MAG: NUDIX hydrolase [Ignavibacteriales bacterium]